MAATNPVANSNAVAELAFGMMVYTARNNFAGTAGTELKGKVLGLHAYGNVGRNMSRIASGFGMKVAAYDPFIDRSVIEKDGIRYVDSVEELYQTCQYISLHILDIVENSIVAKARGIKISVIEDIQRNLLTIEINSFTL